MQKDQVWAQYVKKNPGFETDWAKFTPAGLKKFFDVTWDAAHSLGITNGKAIAKHEHEKKTAGLGAIAQALGL